MLRLISPRRPLHKLNLLINSSNHTLKLTQCVSPYSPPSSSLHTHHPPELFSAISFAAYQKDSKPAPYENLKKKLEGAGINCDTFNLGENNNLICPKCDGGDTKEKTFSLFISLDANHATWHCYRAECGWSGNVKAFESGKATYGNPEEGAKGMDRKIANLKEMKQSLLKWKLSHPSGTLDVYRNWMRSARNI
ncbi:hypothetical protein IFM89_027205 [Coptis chinensis]|uniref:Uncharacterized protein n=1 Tax=Coptis chinensis TaxID=261450 RepID=A0A835IYP9_9MAGN|nr:hypothetical protein IFM89_027205 [Coptis chinensis]